VSRGPRTADDLPISRIVGQNVAALRARHGWSQRTLAKYTESSVKAVHFTTVNRIEKACDPAASPIAVSVDDLVVLAATFGVTVDRLLSEPKCHACLDTPPAGFACRACGAES
jgi:transcriptional regulator with XRE-family HTH domain